MIDEALRQRLLALAQRENRPADPAEHHRRKQEWTRRIGWR